MHNLALDKCQIESFYGLLRLLIFIVSIFWHSKFCVESLSITFFNKSFSLFSSVTKYQFNSEGIYLAVVIYLLFCLDRELLLGNGLSSLPSFYPRLFLPKCITQCYHARHVGHTPGGHPTLGARDFSSSVSGFCQVFIVTRFAARGFGLRPKMCRPSANTENSSLFPIPGINSRRRHWRPSIYLNSKITSRLMVIFSSLMT